MPVRIDIDETALRELLQSPTGPVVRHVWQVANRTLNEARRRCPVDEGHLRASLQMALHAGPGRVWATVGSHLEYAIYVHEGTGLYGPKHHLIRPMSAKVLAWKSRNPKATPKGKGNMVFAAYVKGMKPRPFLVEALKAASPHPVHEGKTML
ncbi:hypothetical protein GCM10009530_60310 [Microbispora corallina]|uniref:HK97 gp10 family phage protein n=1 Tax=Microbispora corallina TaxID=83302 RepID=A0ABQ4FYX5_9ACTN|nr:HK97 gp10 family phage protein [Microbispora corallina]GIH40017.1 hypothetical protein Mco01_30170 [Microbispora corallina]